jgi:hypothetical protein
LEADPARDSPSAPFVLKQKPRYKKRGGASKPFPAFLTLQKNYSQKGRWWKRKDELERRKKRERVAGHKQRRTEELRREHHERRNEAKT